MWKTRYPIEFSLKEDCLGIHWRIKFYCYKDFAKVLYYNFLAFKLNQRACFTNMFTRLSPRLYDYLALHIRERGHVRFDRLCRECLYILFPHPAQNSPTESFDKQVDRAVAVCFPGIPRGIDVNPLQGFALKRTTTRRWPAIALLTQYTSSILSKTCRFPAVSAFAVQTKGTYPWILPHSIYVLSAAYLVSFTWR